LDEYRKDFGHHRTLLDLHRTALDDLRKGFLNPNPCLIASRRQALKKGTITGRCEVANFSQQIIKDYECIKAKALKNIFDVGTAKTERGRCEVANFAQQKQQIL